DAHTSHIRQFARVSICDEYVPNIPQLHRLILPFDHFATFPTGYPWLTEIACGIFYYIQKYMPHGAARWIRRISKRWQRNSQLVESRAIEYARSRGFRYVTCGHTHLPLVSERDGVVYLNSGTWTDYPPCPFVAVHGSEVKLEYWPITQP